MTTEDALPVVAWTDPAGEWHLNFRKTQFATEALVKRSAALAALTLVQAERDAALVDAQSWRQQADSRTADALRFGAERDAMQQERDELRAALERLMRHFPTDMDMEEAGWSRDEIERACAAHDAACAVLTPKATQPTSEASRGR